MHTHATSDSAHSSHDQSDPLVSYWAVFGVLMVLLFVTVGAYLFDFARIKVGESDLGWVNTLIALIIASIKAGVVGLYFMHLRHSTRLTWVVASAGVVFLSIMVLFTFADFQSRKMVAESVREAAVDTHPNAHPDAETLLDHVPNQVHSFDW